MSAQATLCRPNKLRYRFCRRAPTVAFALSAFVSIRPVATSVTSMEAPEKKLKGCPSYGCPLLPQDIYYQVPVKEKLTEIRSLKRDDVEEEDDHFDEDEQSIRSDDGGRTEESRVNMNARRVSPPSLGHKRKEREMNQEEDGYSDNDESIMEDEQPQPTPKVRRKLNPFAKLRKESPDKAMDSPAVKAPKLSRMSTFSAQSREKIKSSKTFL